MQDPRRPVLPESAIHPATVTKPKKNRVTVSLATVFLVFILVGTLLRFAFFAWQTRNDGHLDDVAVAAAVGTCFVGLVALALRFVWLQTFHFASLFVGVVISFLAASLLLLPLREYAFVLQTAVTGSLVAITIASLVFRFSQPLKKRSGL